MMVFKSSLSAVANGCLQYARARIESLARKISSWSSASSGEGGGRGTSLIFFFALYFSRERFTYEC
jgi:hypothetical protein